MLEKKVAAYDQELKEIGVIADTHIPSRGRFIPSKVFSLFQGVQLILHAGDLVDERVIEELQALAPVETVAGNMDSPELEQRHGKIKLIKAQNVTIGLTHGDLIGRRANPAQLMALFEPEEPQAVVFGHLHEPVSKLYQGTLCFNPGSALDPRRRSEPTCGRLLINGSVIQGEIIYL